MNKDNSAVLGQDISVEQGKEVSSITPGFLLQEARKKQKLTPHDVAQSLKLKKGYILEIENDNYNCIPSAAYAKGYIQAYGQLVGIEHEALMTAFNALSLPNRYYQSIDRALASKKHLIPKSSHRVRTSFIVACVLCLLVFLSGVHFYRNHAFRIPNITLKTRL